MKIKINSFSSDLVEIIVDEGDAKLIDKDKVSFEQYTSTKIACSHYSNGAVEFNEIQINGVSPTSYADFKAKIALVFLEAGGSALTTSLKGYKLLGSTIKAEPLGLSAANIVNVTALVDNSLNLIAVYLPLAATITGVQWFQGTTGNYTADNYNGVGLYTYNAGTLTLVASSTDDGNIWKGSSNGWKSKAFTTPYDALPGIYFIAALYNTSAQTTAPSVGQNSSSSNANTMLIDFTNGAKTHGTINANILPSPQVMFGVAANLIRYYFALY